MAKRTVSIVVCAYNEERTIGLVLAKLKELEFVDEIIAVNNGSTDATEQRIQEAQKADSRLKLIRVDKNRGLGFGLMQGIRATSGDIVVRQDADLEYDPFEIKELITPILEGHGTVCFGSRMLVRKAHRCHYYYNYLANVFFTALVDFLVNINFTDVETAAKAFDGPLIRSLPIKSQGFDVEIEMIFRLRSAGAIFYEVPVSYYGRTIEEGKKIRFVDAIHTLVAILKFAPLGRRANRRSYSLAAKTD